MLVGVYSANVMMSQHVQQLLGPASVAEKLVTLSHNMYHNPLVRVIQHIRPFNATVRCRSPFRGTPSYPGRTVTLEEDEHGTVPGAAYRLAGNKEQQRKTLAVCS